MKWIKKDSGAYEAVGKLGKFEIWKNGSKWIGDYEGFLNKKYFQLPAKKSVKILKELCEDNFYWEEEKC